MASGAPRARDASFDILKGVGILSVVVLHTTNWSARNLSMPGSNTWAALTIVNRLMNVGVPLFLLVSALLLARSQSGSSGGWRRFYRRRLQGLLWPFLVWTLVYWVLRDLADLDFDFVFWSSPDRLNDLLFGKASYHLYFLSVLLQFVAVFPAFFLALRRVRLSFPTVVLVSAALQWGAMLVQKQVRLPSPASTFLWYFVPLTVGVWLGLNWVSWPAVWRRWRLPFLVGLIATMMWFLEICLDQIGSEKISSDEYKWAHTAFTFLGSMILLGLSQRWQQAKSLFEKVFLELGSNSLQLYLIHPILLTVLAQRAMLDALKRLPYAPLWVFAIVTVATYAIGRCLGWLRLDGVLFGRPGSPRAEKGLGERPAG